LAVDLDQRLSFISRQLLVLFDQRDAASHESSPIVIHPVFAANRPRRFCSDSGGRGVIAKTRVYFGQHAVMSAEVAAVRRLIRQELDGFLLALDRSLRMFACARRPALIE